MINPNNILTVLKFDGIYTNVTSEVSDINHLDFSMSLEPSKYIYIGYTKPISSIYINLPDGKNNVNTQLTLEYFNGTLWQPLTFVDQTNTLNKSGFITWQIPVDFSETTVNSFTRCWVRLSSVASLTPNIKFDYINLIFSDDTDVGLEYPSVLKDCFYPTGKNDYMIYHVSARDYIMSELLRKGYKKTINGVTQPISQWDILDIYELRMSSLYYAMSQIFFNLSDNSNDNYWQKYLEYKSKFENSFNLGLLRIDQDDDGNIDDDENKPMASYRWVR